MTSYVFTFSEELTPGEAKHYMTVLGVFVSVRGSSYVDASVVQFLDETLDLCEPDVLRMEMQGSRRVLFDGEREIADIITC